MIGMVNKTKARQYIMDLVKRMGREDDITLVAKEFYCELEGVIKNHIRDKVQSHPSGFKKLQ